MNTATDTTDRDEAITNIRATAARLEDLGWDVWAAHRRVNAALCATTEAETVDHIRAAQDILNELADRHVALVAA